MNKDYENYVSEDGTYLLPVVWEVYSTIRVKANNLADALRKARENIDDIPLSSESEYIDGTYEIQDNDLIVAQNYRDMDSKILEFD